MNITPDLPFPNIHNPCANERIGVNLDKHSRMSLGTKDYFVKQISHLSKDMVIVASAKCQCIVPRSPPIFDEIHCSCVKVYHKQEVHFLLPILD